MASPLGLARCSLPKRAVEVWMRSILLTVGCLFVLLRAAAAAEQSYKLVTEIPIGGEGGWDILSVDSTSHRLYLSHATKVVVVDLEKNVVVGEIADTPGVHAFIAVPELKRGFSSNGRENKSSVVDLTTLKTITKVDTGESPDAMAYEPKSGEVYIFNHRGNSVTVIDAKSAKVVSTIELGGSPEFGVADSKAGRVYCNLEDKNEVVAIDAAKHEVVARWPLAPGTEPTGIALDAAHHRLFAACNNKMMVDAQHRNRQGRCDGADRFRHGWLRVRSRDAACLCLLRRRSDDDRERGNAGETHGRANPEDGAARAHDGIGSADASDLFAQRAISAGAESVARRIARTADSRAEYFQASWSMLRPTRQRPSRRLLICFFAAKQRAASASRLRL